MKKRIHKTLLHQVLGILVAESERHAGLVEIRVVAANQDFKHGRFTLQYFFNHHLVRVLRVGMDDIHFLLQLLIYFFKTCLGLRMFSFRRQFFQVSRGHKPRQP